MPKMLLRYSSWTGDSSQGQGAEHSDSPWAMLRRFEAVYLVPSYFILRTEMKLNRR